MADWVRKNHLPARRRKRPTTLYLQLRPSRQSDKVRNVQDWRTVRRMPIRHGMFRRIPRPLFRISRKSANHPTARNTTGRFSRMARRPNSGNGFGRINRSGGFWGIYQSASFFRQKLVVHSSMQARWRLFRSYREQCINFRTDIGLLFPAKFWWILLRDSGKLHVVYRSLWRT